jgi:hypothetical protein
MIILLSVIDDAQDRDVFVRAIVLQTILMVSVQKPAQLRQIDPAVIAFVTSLPFDSVRHDLELGTIVVHPQGCPCARTIDHQKHDLTQPSAMPFVTPFVFRRGKYVRSISTLLKSRGILS